jgi:hypothetical protein
VGVEKGEVLFGQRQQGQVDDMHLIAGCQCWLRSWTSVRIAGAFMTPSGKGDDKSKPPAAPQRGLAAQLRGGRRTST